MRSVGAGIPFNENDGVLEGKLLAAVRGTFPAARRRIGRERKIGDPPSRRLHAEFLAQIGNGHRLRMDQTVHILHALRRERIRIDLEGRERDHIHVPFAHGMPCFVRSDDLPVLMVPHDLIERRPARLRPERRAGDDRVEIDAVLHRAQNVRTQARRLHVLVRVGKRAHFQRRTHLGKARDACVQRGRDVIETPPRLPVKCRRLFLQLPRRPDVAELIAAHKIHVELPAALQHPARAAPRFEIGVHLRDERFDAALVCPLFLFFLFRHVVFSLFSSASALTSRTRSASSSSSENAE